MKTVVMRPPVVLLAQLKSLAVLLKISNKLPLVISI